ncbi:MAG: type II toxin-antitoxin system CcdA family antitoxin [Crocosphaera sp.]
MTASSPKQRISITVDSQLLQVIDQLTDNRSAAVEVGLRLWYQQQIENQLQTFYQNQTSDESKFEEDWGEFAQGQMEETLESEGL